MANHAQRITENLAHIRERIAAAAARSGRAPSDVTLVAVTKTVDVLEIEVLLQAGCCDLGESRPQELWRKAEALAGTPARWHMIGSLQRNKARRTLPQIVLLHSGDSLRLLEAIDRLGAEIERTVPLLLEVNVSGEEAKHGFTPDEIEPLLPNIAALPRVEVRGLMAMAHWGGSLEEARRDFIRLRELRDRLVPLAPPAIRLDHLSMGMSGDFETAVEEGATIVRVGSALFA